MARGRGVSPSRGRGPGCCPRWSQQSGAACRPQCSSTAGPSSTGGCGHRRVRTALGPAPPLLRPPLHLGLTWLAPSARSAQRPGGRCTRCPAPGHSRSLSAEGLAAVTCTGSGLRHPLPLRGLGPPASAFGDPHFVTFDGTNFTFNGRGEYVLLEAALTDLRVQARTQTRVTPEGEAGPRGLWGAQGHPWGGGV